MRIVFDGRADMVSVLDGDTIRFLGRKFRLVGVDTPEKNQTFGVEAKNYLVSLLGDVSWLRIYYYRTGYYGRSIVRIYIPGRTRPRDCGLELLRAGLAWERFSKLRSYKRAFMEAKRNRRGIFQEEDPLPPWEWRKRHR
jgi:endonuclease YncB( thermonuclease family)